MNDKILFHKDLRQQGWRTLSTLQSLFFFFQFQYKLSNSPNMVDNSLLTEDYNIVKFFFCWTIWCHKGIIFKFHFKRTCVSSKIKISTFVEQQNFVRIISALVWDNLWTIKLFIHWPIKESHTKAASVESKSNIEKKKIK